MKHEIVRVMHELRRRNVSVRRAERLTPHMQRITLAGSELEGFHSPSPDDHVKLFIGGLTGIARDYTPRRYDADAQELTLDFALHDAGPATAWARDTAPGQTVIVGGPRASSLVPADFDWWLLIGDETALPAIGRRIEELPAGTSVTSIVAVPGQADEQRFATAADHRAVWVHRPASEAGSAATLLAALADESTRAGGGSRPRGDGFIWIAAESGVARALRQHVLETMRHPLAWTKVAGYWTRGKADAGEKFDR
jgi:NADPH-dependent ferric siderophore reductase